MSELHEGHRKRVKQDFLRYGADKAEPRELLEMLLFYSIPRKDTLPSADALLAQFGSLYGVLNAPRDELIRVPGIGEETVCLIKLALAVTQCCIRSQAVSSPVLNSSQKCGDFLLAQYLDVTEERMSVLCLDSLYTLQKFYPLGTGDTSSVTFGAKAIIKAVTQQPCDLVVLAHNHPSNLLFPSKADVELTRLVRELLDSLGIRLIDHFILGRGEFVSLADSADYRFLFAV